MPVDHRATPHLVLAALGIATALGVGGLVLLDGKSQDADVPSARPTQTSPTTVSVPTPTLSPHEASERVERMLDSKHPHLTDVAMMPTGRALTLWTGACQRRGHPCTQAYVLRDLDGTSATYALPEGKIEAYGAIPYEDGFVLPGSSARGWIVHADGRFDTYAKGLRRVTPAPSLVHLNSYSGVVLDVSTGTTGRLPKPPGHETVSMTLAPGGDLWAVVRTGAR
jgi:hypothetical protein